MFFKPLTRGQPKCKTFTLMLIPGKYGSLKTLNIPRFIIQFIVVFNIVALALISLFILNYRNLRNSYNNYLRYNEELRVINQDQQQEINELKDSADEIKSKLIELQDLEQKLKDKLNISSSASTGSKTSTQISFKTQDIQIDNINTQIASINKLLNSADKKIAYMQSKPSILPASGRITCYYGGRANPFTGKGYEFHSGVDIANSLGTIIKASADGVVEYSGWKEGTGNTVYINHKNGYVTIYGHCSELLAKEGENVKKGQTIALMGSTGRSTGSHVHFSIKLNGVLVDPFKIINGRL